MNIHRWRWTQIGEILLGMTLLGVLCVSGPYISEAEEVDSASLQNQLENKRSKVEQIQQQIKEINNKQYQTQQAKEEAENKVDQLRSEIETLNTEIQDLNDRIAEVKQRIDDTKQSIEELKQNIADLESKIERKKQRVSRLVRMLYTENTLQNEIYAVAQSKSLATAITDISQSLTVQQKIRDELQAITDHRNSLQERKTELAYQQSQLNERQKQLREQRLEKQAKKKRSEAVASEQKREVTELQQKKEQLSARERRLRDKKQRFYQDIKSLKRRLVVQANSPLGAIRWPAPAHTKNVNYCSQGYGMTATARQGTYDGQIHNGIDVAASIGTPIYAVADGTVIGRSQGTCGNGGLSRCGAGWGNWLAIEHPSGHVSVYAHLSGAPSVSEGSAVQKGQRIGTLGNSGYSTGAHLHFAIYNQYSVLDEGGYSGAPAYKGASGTINVQQAFGVSCRE